MGDWEVDTGPRHRSCPTPWTARISMREESTLMLVVLTRRWTLLALGRSAFPGYYLQISLCSREASLTILQSRKLRLRSELVPSACLPGACYP